MGAEKLHRLSQSFLTEALNAPELVSGMEHDRFVLGGVGYVPFASLWYSDSVRELHRLIYDYVVSHGILDSQISGKSDKISMLPDRGLIRFPGIYPSSSNEMWHQDDAANATSSDFIYGGWFNLNEDITQYFKCIPGTHNPTHPIFDSLVQKDGGRRGFASFKHKNDQKLVESYWSEKVVELVEIPPGHLLIFKEDLIHKVFRNPPVSKPILRLHTSFMISESEIPLHDRPTQEKHQRKLLADYFDEQRLVPVRSGQDTQVYSSFHLFPKNQHAVDKLSTHYVSACRGEKGRVLQFLPSLHELGCMKSPMDGAERGMFMPKKLIAPRIDL